jgi:hypothetical protein
LQQIEHNKKEVPLLDWCGEDMKLLETREDCVELKLIAVVPHAPVPALKGTLIDVYA